MTSVCFEKLGISVADLPTECVASLLPRLVRQADVSSLLQKRSTLTALPLSLDDAGTSGTSNGTRKSKGKGKAAAAAADAAATAELNLFATEVAHSAASHRSKLEQHLSAREARLAQLLRASRELELQRHLMGKGTKKEVVVKQKGDKVAKEDEWWMQGVKGAKKSAQEENEGKLPMAEEGVATGARVWVSFGLSFALYLFPSVDRCFSPRPCVLTAVLVRATEIQDSTKAIKNRSCQPSRPFLRSDFVTTTPLSLHLRCIPPMHSNRFIHVFPFLAESVLFCTWPEKRAPKEEDLARGVEMGSALQAGSPAATNEGRGREGKGGVAKADEGGEKEYLIYMHAVASRATRQPESKIVTAEKEDEKGRTTREPVELSAKIAGGWMDLHASSSSSVAGLRATRLNWMLCVRSMIRLTTFTVSCNESRGACVSTFGQDLSSLFLLSLSLSRSLSRCRTRQIRTSSRSFSILPWLMGLLRLPSSSIRYPSWSTKVTKCRSVSASRAGACTRRHRGVLIQGVSQPKRKNKKKKKEDSGGREGFSRSTPGSNMARREGGACIALFFYSAHAQEYMTEDPNTYGSLTSLGRLFMDPFELVGSRQELSAFERSLFEVIQEGGGLFGKKLDW